jgi:hypothetical protein
MVSVFNTGQIRGAGLGQTSPINGEILKIVVFCKELLPNIRIVISNLDGETLCQDNLNDYKTRFYPKNVVMITQEQHYIENFNVLGPILIDVQGLGDNEIIENISIYYK